MTTDTLTKLTPRENECFEDMDRVLDRMLGETNWNETRRTFCTGKPNHSPFDHARQFDALTEYSDEEIRAALREMRARTA